MSSGPSTSSTRWSRTRSSSPTGTTTPSRCHPAREPLFFRHGKIVAKISAGASTRDEVVVLGLIKDAFPERPIYFRSGGYAASLRLGPYLVTQGPSSG